MTLKSVPRASTNRIYEKPCLANGSLSYQRIYNRLAAILSERGYNNTRRFLTPRGFGIATSFERISDQGYSFKVNRWNKTPFYNSLWTILTGKAKPGRYRSFIITYGISIPEKAKPASFTDFADFAEGQDLALPEDVKRKRGRAGDHLEVFIYEYARPGLRQKARLDTTLQASEHLERSRLGPRIDAICGRAE